MNKSAVSGAAGVIGLLAVVVGLAFFLWYRQQPKSYGETVLSPEVIEVNSSVESVPGAPSLTKQQLLIDKINRGIQFDLPNNRADWGNPKLDFSRLATSYYHRDGPLGRVLERFHWFAGPTNTFSADARLPASLCGSAVAGLGISPLPMACVSGAWSEPPIGVIFLGPGTIASYARPLQTVDFFERSPHIIEIATKTKSFSFVRDAELRGAHIRILPGLERKTLETAGPRGFYHVLVVETSRGSSARPSTELLTVEALRLFADTLAPEGIICFHTSSRDYDLDRVVAAAAGDCGLAARQGLDKGRALGQFTSDWVMVARNANDLRFLVPAGPGLPGASITWTNLGPAGIAVWHDAERPNLARVHR
jgi:hypothetical protein